MDELSLAGEVAADSDPPGSRSIGGTGSTHHTQSEAVKSQPNFHINDPKYKSFQ